MAISTFAKHLGRFTQEDLDMQHAQAKQKRVSEWMTTINYLHALGKLTTSEVGNLHEMIKSPDTDNVYIAREIVKNKLDEIGLEDIRC